MTADAVGGMNIQVFTEAPSVACDGETKSCRSMEAFQPIVFKLRSFSRLRVNPKWQFTVGNDKLSPEENTPR